MRHPAKSAGQAVGVGATIQATKTINDARRDFFGEFKEGRTGNQITDGNYNEALLVKIETESFAGASSVVTYESSYYSEQDSEYWDEEEEREAAMWARRAQRAEIKAELAAREALLEMGVQP